MRQCASDEELLPARQVCLKETTIQEVLPKKLRAPSSVRLGRLAHHGKLKDPDHHRRDEIQLLLGLLRPDVDDEPVTRSFEVLQCSFGTDADNAATAAVRVFRHVYQHDDVVYVLHEN